MQQTEPARLLLVRHGVTGWNIEGRYTSTSDISLHPDAAASLAATADRLRAEHIDRVFTSPLRRTIETAEILRALGGFTARPTMLDDLREMDFGDFEGRSREELRASPLAATYDEWMRVHEEFPTAPGGETWADVSARASRVLALAAEGGTTLVISHGYLLRTLIVTAIGTVPSGATRTVRLGNGGVTELRGDGQGAWHVASQDVGGIFPEGVDQRV